MAMHDGNNKDSILPDGVKQRAGKYSRQFSADILLYFRPQLWTFANAFNRRINALNEALAKILLN